MSDLFKCYYMRCNHTFLKLPLDQTKAMDVLCNDYSRDGNTCGVLFGEGPNGKITPALHAKTNEKWDEFEPRAIAFVKKVIKAAEEYEAFYAGM